VVEFGERMASTLPANSPNARSVFFTISAIKGAKSHPSGIVHVNRPLFLLPDQLVQV